MSEPAETTTKICPAHQPAPTALPLAEFGVSRARPDGRNLYCRGCNRRKTTASRRALRAYRAERRARRQRAAVPKVVRTPAAPVPLTPAERVREAIRGGAESQRQIAQATRLRVNDVGEALAELLLWTREIKTELVGESRRYYLNQAAALPRPASAMTVSEVSARQGDARATGRQLPATDRKREATG